MKVFYRMTSLASTNPSPFSQNDKDTLNEVCLKSFLGGFFDTDISVHFLLDHCSKECITMVKKHVPKATFEVSESGINATMLRSYELAIEEEGYVLFQECDYLYRPNIGKQYLRALEELDIVSPYDHKNFYIDHDIHNQLCEIQLVDNHHFRTTERNTMTWATHSDIIRENADIFLKYGYLDDQVWYDLAVAGRQLWVPIPSFATHCVTDYLAPGIDWTSIWQKYS